MRVNRPHNLPAPSAYGLTVFPARGIFWRLWQERQRLIGSQDHKAHSGQRPQRARSCVYRTRVRRCNPDGRHSHRATERPQRPSLPVAANHLAHGNLHIIRYGLLLGEMRRGRFHPAHELALAMAAGDATHALSLAAEDASLAAYIAGADLPSAGPDGWTLVTVAGYGLGWGKRVGGRVRKKPLPPLFAAKSYLTQSPKRLTTDARHGPPPKNQPHYACRR